MTRWFALGLLFAGSVAVNAQGIIVQDYSRTAARLARPNPLGGGLVMLPIFQIAAQPPVAQAQQKAPVPPPPGNQPPQPPPRRHLRSTVVPAGPAKLDQHGDSLPPGAVARYGTTRLRHGPEPLGLGFSPDGKMLGSISPSEDGIRLWDPKTGKELYRLNSPATFAAFARDGSIVLVDETRCKVWIPAANSIRDLPEKTLPENVQVIAVHPDGRTFAAGIQHKILQIDLLTGKLVRELKCPPEQTPLRLSFSPDGRWLAGTGQKTGIWLWDLRSGKRIRTYNSDFDFPEFTFSADGSRIAIAAGPLRIYSTDSEEMIENYKAPEVLLQNPRFSKDGKWIFGITPEGTFHKINVESGQIQDSNDPPEETLHPPMAIAPEGAYAAALDSSGAIRVWDPKTGDEPEIERLPVLIEPQFSKDGKTVWCLSVDGRVHEFEAGTGKPIKVIELSVPENSPIWWSHDHRRAIACIVGAEDFELQVIDVDTKRMVSKLAFPANEGFVPTVGFCTNDRSRVAVFGVGAVSIINVDTGKSVRSMIVGKADEMQPVQGAISPDGRLVAVNTRPLSIWEVSTGKKRYDLPEIVNVGGVVYSTDGRYLAAWNSAGNIVVFDVRLGTIVRRIQTAANNEAIPHVTFSLDGTRLAAGDGDGGITVWDVTTGQTILSYDRHDGSVTGLAFSPDGTKLASTSQDGTVLVWEVSIKVAEKTPEIAVGGLEEAFRLLASADAANAQRGMEFLYRKPMETIKLCSERILVPAATPTEKITKLIENLGSDDFPERQAAVKDLEAIGGEAIAALRNAAEKSDNQEVRKLAGEVIGRHEASTPKGEDLRLLRAVELLENLATSEAKKLLVKWAAGPNGHRMTKEAAAALSRMKAIGK